MHVLVVVCDGSLLLVSGCAAWRRSLGRCEPAAPLLRWALLLLPVVLACSDPGAGEGSEASAEVGVSAGEEGGAGDTVSPEEDRRGSTDTNRSGQRSGSGESSDSDVDLGSVELGVAASQPAPFEPAVDLDDEIVGPEGPPCDAVREVFQVSCGGECHVGVGIGNFAVGEREARAYVGKPPNLNSPRCGLMINPDSPFDSLILTKVTGDYPFEEGECRTLMPPPYGGITNEQVECLESWLWQFRR